MHDTPTEDGVPVLELRTYRLVPGMRDAFVEHVRDVRLPIYDRIGWRCDGFWSTDDDPGLVHYQLRWRSLEDRVRLRAVLAEDPEWIAYKESDPPKLVDEFVTTVMHPVV